jgi:hypothetical protein
MALRNIDSTHDADRVHGPMNEYDARVESGRLRDDEHQRSMMLEDWGMETH